MIAHPPSIMNITLKQVRAFVAVVQANSFAEAASVIHLSQPALSSAIKVLEASIGGPLLVRTSRTCTLTPEGESFYPAAMRLLADWESALDNVHSRFALREGKISIAAIPAFASSQLPMAIRHFKEQYPEVKVALNDVIAEEVVAMVRSGRVELGISFDPGETDDLTFTPLFDDHFIVVLPSGHPLLKHEYVSALRLLDYDFIALQAPSRIRQLIIREFAKEDLSLSPVFETNQLATIGRMVVNGLGVSVAPSLCKQQMKELGGHCLPLINPDIRQQVGLITKRRQPLSAATQAMAATLRETFSEFQ